MKNSKNTQKNTPKLSQTIGQWLAHLQATIDDLIQIWFKKLGKVKKVPVRKTDTFAKKVVFVSLWFIADVGSSFYKEYRNFKNSKR